MIDISVTDLVKSFDLEKKILDGISFQVDTGERVGLLGKNGAGKTTLFNILTGDLDYDSGEVLIAPGRRVGLISQIPVYPAGYTVEDVLRSAFQRTTALKEEMDALTRRMEQGDSAPILCAAMGSSPPGSRDWGATTPTQPSTRCPTACPSTAICGGGCLTSCPAAKRPG